MALHNVFKKDKIQNILTTEQDKWNELSRKYNNGVEIVREIDTTLFPATSLGIAGVWLLSMIVVAPAVIGMKQWQSLWHYLEWLEIKTLKTFAESRETCKDWNMKSIGWSKILRHYCLRFKGIDGWYHLGWKILILIKFQKFTQTKEEFRVILALAGVIKKKLMPSYYFVELSLATWLDFVFKLCSKSCWKSS